MQQHQTPFCFIVQVSSETSRFCKISKDVYVLLLPCPKALFSLICDYVHVLKLLFMSGDVELNPGPPKEDIGKQYNDTDVILTTVLATVQRIEQGQISMLSEMKELKEKQKTTDERMQELYSRVVALETKTGNASDVQNEGA
ncbi:unnamed protein product [Ixodes pacificus]